MELIILVMLLITIIGIFILFKLIKRILNNQEEIKLELNKLSVLVKYKDK